MVLISMPPLGVRYLNKLLYGTENLTLHKRCLLYTSLPFPVIAVAGCVLLFFLPCGEVRAARNQDRENTRVNLIAFIHVRRQFPGIGVKQAVDFLMVHRVYPCLLYTSSSQSRYFVSAPQLQQYLYP